MCRCKLNLPLVRRCVSKFLKFGEITSVNVELSQFLFLFLFFFFLPASDGDLKESIWKCGELILAGGWHSRPLIEIIL